MLQRLDSSKKVTNRGMVKHETPWKDLGRRKKSANITVAKPNQMVLQKDIHGVAAHGPFLSCESAPPILALLLQGADLGIQIFDKLQRSIHGGHQRGPLAFPPFQPVKLGATPAIFGLDLLTEPTFVAVILGHIHEPHAACFARAVFVVAPVSKARPAPVSTGVSFLVVKTHTYQIC
jgi:hypothetical protein